MKLELAKSSVHSLDVLKNSGNLLLQNFFPLLFGWALSLGLPVAILLTGVLVGRIVDQIAIHKAGYATLVGLLIPGLLISAFWTGWNKITLKVARAERVRFSDIWCTIPQMLSGVVALVITSSLIGIGTSLVIPGALLFLRWQLVPYYIVDQGDNPFRALSRSWHDTSRIFIPLGLLNLVFLGLHTVSAATIVGPLICHMMLGVASAIVYDKWVLQDALEIHPNEQDPTDDEED